VEVENLGNIGMKVVPDSDFFFQKDREIAGLRQDIWDWAERDNLGEWMQFRFQFVSDPLYSCEGCANSFLLHLQTRAKF
jgi:hypothetical protein